MEPKTVTHIAGVAIQVGSQLRQLCAWCGKKIIDVDLSTIMSTDGRPYGAFGDGTLVQVFEGDGFSSHTVVKPEVDAEGALRIPDDCCARPWSKQPAKPGPQLEVVR